MKPIWTEEKIKQGFEKFRTSNGRLPKANEIDKLDYLPSSRAIQKRFGGLEALRGALGYKNTHFGKGVHRSKIATVSGQRSRELEADLEKFLHEHFGLDAVQTELAFHGKHRIDFYITTTEDKFGVDIFYAQTIRTLQSSVNIKMKKYDYFCKPLYLVVANDAITQTHLNAYSKNKELPFPDNVSFVTLTGFKKLISTTWCTQ